MRFFGVAIGGLGYLVTIAVLLMRFLSMIGCGESQSITQIAVLLMRFFLAVKLDNGAVRFYDCRSPYEILDVVEKILEAGIDLQLPFSL